MFFPTTTWICVLVCLWEADSIEILDKYLRNKVGKASVDSYYQINEANAMGLLIWIVNREM